VNAAGSDIAYLTFLGTKTWGSGTYVSPATSVSAIAVDSSGNAYVAGSTSDPYFPVTPSAFQTKPGFQGYPPDSFTPPPTDGFVVKLNPAGSALVWASYLGGTSIDQVQTVAVDSSGDVWISGNTQSTDFPASSGFPGGGDFLVEFNPSSSALLNAVRYPSGSVRAALAVDSSGLVHACGANGLVSIFTPTQLTAARIYGIANAAGGLLSGRVAPGELISIYGLQIGPSTPASATFDSSGFLPTTLAGTKVFINGIAAPLLDVSGTQINLVAPLELIPGSFPTLQVSFTNVFILGFRLAVDPAQPQVFRHPDGSAASINQDGTVNSSDHPAKVGDFVSIWVTGVGFTQGVDGQMQTAPQTLCGCIIHDIVAGEDIFPAYAGAAPGMVTGVVQINFQVSSVATDGFTLSAGGRTSDPFTLHLTP
jgi:uncharacterized protein (TIGR03437 family)